MHASRNVIMTIKPRVRHVVILFALFTLVPSGRVGATELLPYNTSAEAGGN